MVRRRAPGGGRKPKGAVAMRSQLTIRIPDDLRAELKAAAKGRGRNLTDELLGRLRASFAREREQKRDPTTRALAFLISQVAEQVHMYSRLGRNWHRNPFVFRAFKLAVARLLDSLEPPGELKSPYDDLPDTLKNHPMTPWLVDRFKTPEDTAERAADYVLTELYPCDDDFVADPNWIRGARKWAAETGVTSTAGLGPRFQGFLDNLESEYYGMSNARDALEDTPQKKGG